MVSVSSMRVVGYGYEWSLAATAATHATAVMVATISGLEHDHAPFGYPQGEGLYACTSQKDAYNHPQRNSVGSVPSSFPPPRRFEWGVALRRLSLFADYEASLQVVMQPHVRQIIPAVSLGVNPCQRNFSPQAARSPPLFSSRLPSLRTEKPRAMISFRTTPAGEQIEPWPTETFKPAESF